MSKRKKSHRTTKNTMPKMPISRFRVIRVEMSNGTFDLVTDFKTQEDFDKVFMEWYNSPKTRIWTAHSLIDFVKTKHPGMICLLEKDFIKITKGKIIPATKEEWEAENN